MLTFSYLGEEPENLLCNVPILYEGEPSLLAVGEERCWLSEVTGRWASLQLGAGVAERTVGEMVTACLVGDLRRELEVGGRLDVVSGGRRGWMWYQEVGEAGCGIRRAERLDVVSGGWTEA